MPRSRRAVLVVNPTLRLTAAAEVALRGAGRRRVELTDPGVLAYVLAALAGRRRPRLGVAQRRALRAAGVLVRATQVPRDVHLDARLDPARPSRRQPRARGAVAARQPAAPRLTRGCRLFRGPSLPRDLAPRGEAPEPFLPDADVLWVARPGSGIAVPYTLAPGLARLVRDHLRQGRRPASLPPTAMEVLREVGALAMSPRGRRDTGEDWSRRLQDWRRALRAHGFVVLRGLFAPRFAGALRDYYRRVAAEGYLLGGQARRRGAPLLYDEPVLTFLAHQLASVVRRVTGDRARARFTYLRVYDPGARLGRHRDRALCRWTLDLVVGGGPAPARRTAWPLWMDGRRGPEAVRLGLGDAVLYRGDRVEHWRSSQRRGRTTVLASLHFGAPSR